MPGAFFARFHFHTSKLHVIVGSSDAAKTAILTGAISGALYPTFEFLKRHSNLHARGADILIAPDYTAEKIKFNGNIAFSMSILGFMIACLKLCVIATVKVVNFFIDKKRQKNEADDEKSSENKTEEN